MRLFRLFRLFHYLTALAGSLPLLAVSQTLCEADESVQFSCPVGSKIVSLCGTSRDGALTALTYRYGRAGQIEKAFSATADNGRFFSFDVAPAAPQTSVEMIWFDQGSHRYLLSQCSGSDCPFSAGLAVLRDDKVLMNQRCVVPDGQPRARFAGDLVEFTSSAGSSKALTPLVRNGNAYGSDITRVYRVKP